MHVALVVLAQLLSHPVSPATPLVLDGCNTASAIRAAEIREMRPGQSDTLAAVADLLLEKDGAVCLMESDVLVDVFVAQPGSDIVARTLVVGLASDLRHIAARAGVLVARVGLADPKGFDRILRRDEMTRRGWSVMRNALNDLPPSPRKSVLMLMADRNVGVARAN